MDKDKKQSPLSLHRRSIRMKGYNYSLVGAYFVTAVTYQWACIFGNVVNGEIRLNQLGQIAAQTWEWLSKQYAYVEVDPYIVMPNHFHGVLQIIEFDDECRGRSRPAPTKIKTLGQLIGAFKQYPQKNKPNSAHIGIASLAA